MSEIKIAVADDHALVREAVKTLLESEKSIQILFEACNGRELLDKIPGNMPEIILLDIEMPILSGKEALRILKQRFNKIKVIVLTSHDQRDLIIDFIKMGASAFLPKDCNRAKLIEAILAVHTDGTYFDKKVAEVMAKELAAGIHVTHEEGKIKFSETELSIIKMLCQLKISKEIADALNLSTRTVEWHRVNIMNALKTKDIDVLILYAIKNELVRVV